MKRVLGSIPITFISFLAHAQESATTVIEIRINGEALDYTGVSKIALLVIFTIASLVVVYRTFRNKPGV